MKRTQEIMLCTVVRRLLHEHRDTMIGMRMIEMADGTGNWAVFADTIERGVEHSHRVVIDRQGEEIRSQRADLTASRV